MATSLADALKTVCCTDNGRNMLCSCFFSIIVLSLIKVVTTTLFSFSPCSDVGCHFRHTSHRPFYLRFFRVWFFPKQLKQIRLEETYFYWSSKDFFRNVSHKSRWWGSLQKKNSHFVIGLFLCEFVFSADSFAGSLVDDWSTMTQYLSSSFLLVEWYSNRKLCWLRCWRMQ